MTLCAGTRAVDRSATAALQHGCDAETCRSLEQIRDLQHEAGGPQQRLEDDRGRWPGGLRCAQHPYSLPFTSHQASLVPTGFHASEAQTDRVGAGADLIGRLEEELNQLGDASGQEGEALQVGERQEARR